MRVIIVMVMQTSLMVQLHVLLKPSNGSIGLGPRVPTVANGHLNLNYPNSFILYYKSTIQVDIT